VNTDNQHVRMILSAASFKVSKEFVIIYLASRVSRFTSETRENFDILLI